MDSFKFRSNVNIRFGVGILSQADKMIADFGFKNIAAIVDRNVINNERVSFFIDKLKKPCTVTVFETSVSEPDYFFLDEYKKRFNGIKFDCLIGIGGGSTMDLAKGIAVLLANDGPAIGFKGFPKLRNVPLPVITIPTLPGTGSEVAFNAVFTDTAAKTRLGINTELNFPVLTIVDPELSLSAPRKAVVSATLDCICHILESYISKNASPFTRGLAKAAFGHMCQAVEMMAKNFSGVEGRSELYMASMLANMALNNSGSGLGGAFSYPLGARFGVPHGFGEGIFVPYLARLYVSRGFLGYTELYDITPGSDKTLSEKEKNIRFCNYLDDAYERLDAPKSLRTFGIDNSAIPILVEDVRKSFREAPVKFDEDDCVKLFENFIK